MLLCVLLPDLHTLSARYGIPVCYGCACLRARISVHVYVGVSCRLYFQPPVENDAPAGMDGMLDAPLDLDMGEHVQNALPKGTHHPSREVCACVAFKQIIIFIVYGPIGTSPFHFVGPPQKNNADR